MKKKLCIMLLALVMICTVFVGCDVNETQASSNGSLVIEDTSDETLYVNREDLGMEELFSFYNYSEQTTYTYLREKTTTVIYFLLEEDSSIGGFDGTSGLTVMMDPHTDGPLIYDNFIKYLENGGTEISESTTNSLS